MTPPQNTPLHCAAGSAYFDLVRLLLKYNADPNLKNLDGDTPLHYAAGNQGFPTEACWTIEALIQAGANPNLKNRAGQTPVDLARERGTKQAVALLEKYTTH